jgi:peptidyl-prolyl cis-trans isomerase D
MLDAMRRHTTGWIAKVLLGLLVVSFAIWGIGDVFRGFAPNQVATVGSVTIRDVDFNEVYQRELSNYQRQTNRALTRDQAQQLGLPARVLSQLVTEAALDDRARALRLDITDAELVRQIQSDPSFRDANGAFNRQAFGQLLRDNGWSEDQYVVTRRATAKRQLLVDSLIGGVTTPDVYMEAVNRYRAEERTIDTLTVTADLVGTIEPPTDDQLKAFFEPRKAAFRAPEYRKATVMTATVERLAELEEVAEDDLRRVYEGQSARFTTPEQRRIQRLSFPDRATAEAIRARLIAGEAIDGIITERGLRPEDVNLGLLARDRVIDTILAEKVFTLPAAGVTDVFEGRFGSIQIAVVSEILPESRKSFEDASAEIRQRIATERAEERLINLRNEVEDARAGGGSLAEVATRLKLDTLTIEAIDREGKAPDGTSVGGLPTVAGLVNQFFETDVGIEADPVSLGGRGFVWFEVLGITPARDRTLEEARAQAEVRWRIEETAKRINDRATEALERLKKGEAIADVAQALGGSVRSFDKITRVTQSPDIPATLLTSAFEVPQGTAGSAIGADTARILFVVREVTEPVFFADAPDLAGPRSALASSMQNTLLDEYLKKVQSDVGVTINQAVVNRVLGATQSN